MIVFRVCVCKVKTVIIRSTQMWNSVYPGCVLGVMAVSSMGALSQHKETALWLSNASHACMTVLWVLDAVMQHRLDVYLHHICGCVAIQCTAPFQWQYPRLACAHLFVLELPVVWRNSFVLLVSRAVVNPLVSCVALQFLTSHGMWAHCSCYACVVVMYLVWALFVLDRFKLNQ
jgi:hypothetical protein